MSKQPPKKFKQATHFSLAFDNQHPHLLKKAIMDTLRYRQIFGCPMTYFQIWNFLIGGKNTINGRLMSELNSLVSEKKIYFKDGWYSLDKINTEETEKRCRHTHRLITRADHISRYLKAIPWIEMAAVTGSVAAFNAEEDADIDLFIVTKPDRLFLSRFFVVLLLKSLGVYWNPKKPGGTICPNIFTTASALEWKKSKQSLFVANEVALLYPLFSRQTCYFDFLKENGWAAHYLPNLHIPDFHTRRAKDPALTGKLLDILEAAFMKLQTRYMKRKQTSEVVTKNFIHFNTHDMSQEVLNKYQNNFPK